MRSYNKKFVYFICLVSAMGGLLFGYDWVVIGGAKPFYELYFDIADVPAMQGLAHERGFTRLSDWRYGGRDDGRPLWA